MKAQRQTKCLPDGTWVEVVRDLNKWPDPASIPIGRNGYKTPDGELPRVTSILKVLGLSTNALVAWSAREERKAVLEAAAEEVFAEGTKGEIGHDGFIKRVEARIGSAKQHQKQMQAAAEIGTQVHAEVHAFLRGNALSSGLGDQVQWAVMAFQDWFTKSGLTAVRMEQPVWDAKEGFAGTIDLIAEHPTNGLGLVDFKTSKSIYDDHHLQVAAYMHAGRNFADLKWAQIVRLPKNLEDPGFEVKPLGSLYDRQLGQDQLYSVFRSALNVYKLLIAKG